MPIGFIGYHSRIRSTSQSQHRPAIMLLIIFSVSFTLHPRLSPVSRETFNFLLLNVSHCHLVHFGNSSLFSAPYMLSQGVPFKLLLPDLHPSRQLELLNFTFICPTYLLLPLELALTESPSSATHDLQFIRLCS